MLHSCAKVPLITYFASYFPTMRNCLTLYEHIVYLYILIFSDFPQIVLSLLFKLYEFLQLMVLSNVSQN